MALRATLDTDLPRQDPAPIERTGEDQDPARGGRQAPTWNSSGAAYKSATRPVSYSKTLTREI